MITFPNAKINLGLNVISKRQDGYHNISSCFYPIGWSDILEIIPSKKFQFSTSGQLIDGNEESNLCVKAYHLLNEGYSIAPVHIHLHKVIPMGAGLGGGSSDGAFTLKMLNQLFELDLSENELEKYASQLGSDCTFFIKNKPALVSGVGNELKVIDFSLSDFQILVVYPDIHMPTGNAYEGIIPKEPMRSIESIINKGMDRFMQNLRNDFEIPIGNINPEILKLKDRLYQIGATYASMTGSGSAVYGIFDQNRDLQELKQHFGVKKIWTEGF